MRKQLIAKRSLLDKQPGEGFIVEQRLIASSAQRQVEIPRTGGFWQDAGREVCAHGWGLVRLQASNSKSALTAISGAIVLLCSGCATLPSGRAWGESATARPGWAQVREAAKDAAIDPWVWGPLIGAAALQIDGFDRRISNWARTNTPVFGSQQSAADWSDDLRSATVLVEMATLIATPSGNEPAEWLSNKGKGAAVELLAIKATSLLTGSLKSATDRERPDGSDDESFPSGHASSAAVLGRLAQINLVAVEMDPRAKRAADISIGAIVIGTGWARVEAGVHFPSDSLAGMALGNFLASFFTRAFLGVEGSNSIAVAAIDGGAVLQWRLMF